MKTELVATQKQYHGVDLAALEEDLGEISPLGFAGQTAAEDDGVQPNDTAPASVAGCEESRV